MEEKERAAREERTKGGILKAECKRRKENLIEAATQAKLRRPEQRGSEASNCRNTKSLERQVSRITRKNTKKGVLNFPRMELGRNGTE